MLQLNCLGMRCPLPIIESAKALKTLMTDDQISLQSDDPATWVDLSAWARMSGNEVLQIDKTNFLITKKR
ncbi:MAG: sulfurtransferase TusA family protein [Actinobacteria bacterium]|jgi:tRNA 2-thiouridine synthesizing protein A|nr:sulfurtransferase TusA family protein [Actinomycetota bacterium]NDH12992.1 sulfurtransferase TusA family protein [Actinomycetota bacterium]TRZ84718.1 MAG: sulfurtransferase TusA family protein [Streptomycetaceae bacterium]